ncbi:hypothetical protein CLG85_014955 [Yangia mangrovi]|uniref:Uncharacterized protein n=1 Tax=Alloyangia mangrovi TaxID=1779329 RepID=A0ABT2KQA3_9RHOB|nr:hypothetical protein [Alloyangia mangrovi]MCA0939402.1 hypothetical protein [Alloyangia pacifica]MCA0943577.1 hypothetical protein [Alloyangia pacifica]MCT4371547.1 hypothetical protein [Alloyangia mangrovi]
MELYLIGLAIGLLIMSPVIALILFAGIVTRKGESRTPPSGGARARVSLQGFAARYAKP